jgi:chemotaxis protein methyltransferase CheR
VKTEETKNIYRLKLEKEDFDWFRNVIREEVGINILEGKYNFLYNRLFKRLRTLGMDSFIEYRQYLKTIRGRKDELMGLINTIVTPESSFFRYQPHMDMFSSVLLPELSEKKLAQGQPVNILCLGCARGEEPYSLAMLACEGITAPQRLKLKIRAVDISSTLLDEAEKAIYPKEKLESVPEKFSRYFVEEGERCRLVNIVTRMVNFQRFNIIKDNWDLFPPMDLIMCRNTTIYFEEQKRREIYSKMMVCLVENGYLAMSPTEMIESGKYGLDYIGHSIYRRVKN